MNIILKIFSWFDWFFEKINVLFIALLALSVIVTVFLRYVMNISFIWAEEAILFTFLATTYFGIIICVKEDEEIAIDFFIERSNPGIKKILNTIITLVSVITLVWIAYLSLNWINTVGSTLSSGLKIAYKYIYMWMPITFSIAAVYEMRKYVQKMQGTYVKEVETIKDETMKEGGK